MYAVIAFNTNATAQIIIEIVAVRFITFAICPADELSFIKLANFL